MLLPPRHRLARLTEACVRNPHLTLALGALVTLASIWIASGLEIRTGRLDLAPQDDPIARGFVAFNEEFGTLNRLVAVVTGMRAPAATEEFARRLSAQRELIAEASARIDLDAYLDQFLFTLRADEIGKLRREIQDGRLDLAALARDPTMATLLERLCRPARASDAPSQARIEGLTRMVRWLAGTAPGGVPTLAELLGKPEMLPTRPDFVDPKGFLTSRDRTKSMVVIRAADPSDANHVVVPFVEAVEAAARAVGAEYGVTIELGGFPALKVAEKRAAEWSLAASSCFSFVGVLALFMMTFRTTSLPILSMACLSISVVWTAAVATLVLGHLTVVSASFVSILLGLGDFSTHLVARFEQDLPRVKDVDEALIRAADELAPGILTGSLTTACAFLCMIMTGFPAFEGLGVTAGSGIMLALLETFTILPAALKLWLSGREVGEPVAPPMAGGFRELARRICHLPTLGLLVAAGIALLCLKPSLELTLDPDFEKMNDPQSPAVRVQDSLLKDFGFSPVINVLIVDSLAQVEAATELALAEPTVGLVDSPARFAPAHPERNTRAIATLARLLAEIGPLRPRDSGDGERVRRAASRLRGQVRLLGLLLVTRGDTAASLAAHELGVALQELADAAPAGVADRDRHLMTEIGQMLDDLATASAGRPKSLAEIAPERLARYRSDRGRLAVFLAPTVDVHKPGEARRFNEACTRIAATVGAETTGNGLLIERMIGLLVQGYERTVLLSTLAITLLVLIGFRNGAAALLTLSVAGMGILATRASMLVCGITLNPANLVAVPLILGLGVDNAVHLIHAWLEGEPIEEVLSQTGRPLAMNAATSVVGFGGLMLARHNGLYSLGWSLAVGITWCWAATMLLVPGTVLILERLRRSGISTLEAPVSYRVYASGG